ncbi:KUP/HAK/KT family potassium transporter [Paraburkholderia hospita]
MLPSLVLNYFGQAARVLSDPSKRVWRPHPISLRAY